MTPGDTGVAAAGEGSTGTPGDAGEGTPCSGCTGPCNGCCRTGDGCRTGEGCMTPGDVVVRSNRSSSCGGCNVARSNSRSCRSAGSVSCGWVSAMEPVVQPVLGPVSESSWPLEWLV